MNISDPENPDNVGAVETLDYAEGVAVSGDYAYVVDGDSGLQVVDISDPANPFIAGDVDTRGSALGVAVSGGYAYVADKFGLVIFQAIPDAP